MPEANCDSDLVGVVLAGGLSSRLGQDKAQVRLAFGDEPDFLARAAGVLASCCRRVIVIGRAHPEYECYPDATPGCGPTGGIATALEWCASACLVLSCDLPFMERGVLERLVAWRETRPEGTLSTAYRQKETGHVEALVAIYEREALPFFRERLRDKKLKLSRVLPLARQYFLDYTLDGALPFFNINYPADLIVARRLMRALGD